MITGGSNGNIHIWNLNSSNPLFTIQFSTTPSQILAPGQFHVALYEKLACFGTVNGNFRVFHLPDTSLFENSILEFNNSSFPSSYPSQVQKSKESTIPQLLWSLKQPEVENHGFTYAPQSLCLQGQFLFTNGGYPDEISVWNMSHWKREVPGREIWRSVWRDGSRDSILGSSRGNSSSSKERMDLMTDLSSCHDSEDVGRDRSREWNRTSQSNRHQSGEIGSHSSSSIISRHQGPLSFLSSLSSSSLSNLPSSSLGNSLDPSALLLNRMLPPQERLDVISHGTRRPHFDILSPFPCNPHFPPPLIPHPVVPEEWDILDLNHRVHRYSLSESLALQKLHISVPPFRDIKVFKSLS